LHAQLPSYQSPLFLRLQRSMEVTSTFKQRKGDAVTEGFDPQRIGGDALNFRDEAQRKFVKLDHALQQNTGGAGETVTAQICRLRPFATRHLIAFRVQMKDSAISSTRGTKNDHKRCLANATKRDCSVCLTDMFGGRADQLSEE
jgi:hypothetical protein